MSLIIYAVTCSPVQSKINVAAARKYRRHRCETQLYTSFAVAPVTSTKNQYFPPTWNILSAVLDEFSISILSTRLITIPKKEKKMGGGRELKNIQSLSSRRFVHGDTWLCKYFHFKHCQGQRSSFTSRIIGCTPGDVYRILKYVGERATSIPRSNFTRTRYAATWPQFLGDRESRISFDHWPTSKIVLRIISRNWENDADTRDLPHV